jgi:hypothetical protein
MTQVAMETMMSKGLLIVKNFNLKGTCATASFSLPRPIGLVGILCC